MRYVLKTLVKYGAPERILVEGAPHLGTDNLVRLLRNMRQDLRDMGGEIHFGTKASKYLIEDGTIRGVEAECVEVNERTAKSKDFDSEAREHESYKTFYGDAVVLATGHSGKKGAVSIKGVLKCVLFLTRGSTTFQQEMFMKSYTTLGLSWSQKGLQLDFA